MCNLCNLHRCSWFVVFILFLAVFTQLQVLEIDVVMYPSSHCFQVLHVILSYLMYLLPQAPYYHYKAATNILVHILYGAASLRKKKHKSLQAIGSVSIAFD